LDRSHAFSAATTLTEREGAALVEICRRLGGIPLAIELGAARRRLLSIPQIAERLSDPALVLDYAPEVGLDQLHTIRQTIAWSYDALPAPARAALRSLCVFEAPFSIEAAEAVVGSISDSLPLIEVLSDLIDRALVVIVAGADETRYSILDPIRDFGVRELIDAGAASRAYDAALAHYLDFAKKLSLPEGEPAPRRAFDAAQREQVNIRGLLAAAALAGANLDLAVSVLERMSLFWQLRGYVSDGRACTTALLSATWRPGATKYPALLLEACTFARLEGDYAQARAFASECRELSRSAVEKALEADTLFAEAVIDYTSTNWAVARETLLRAAAACSALHDDARQGRCRANIALTYLNEGNKEAAAIEMTEAIEALRRGGHRRWLSVALGAMGYIERCRGRIDDAATFSREALAAGMRTGDRLLAGSALGNLAFVYVSRGDESNARTYIRAGLDLLSDGAFPFVVLSLLESTARLFVRQARFGDAGSAVSAITAIIERYSIARSEDDLTLLAELRGTVSDRLPEFDVIQSHEAFREKSISQCCAEIVALVMR
jgi:non-specific serine/threonine protein kinase